MSETVCRCGAVDIREEELERIIERNRARKGAVIPILHEAQELYGCLPLNVQKIISQKMKIPLTEIYGIVTFYTRFSIKPKGKYKIQVCMGTACYVKGAGQIQDKFMELLGIGMGECTESNLFSLEACRCVGACGLAPVVMINDEVYGSMKPEDVYGIIEKYRKLDAEGDNGGK